MNIDKSGLHLGLRGARNAFVYSNRYLYAVPTAFTKSVWKKRMRIAQLRSTLVIPKYPKAKVCEEFNGAPDIEFCYSAGYRIE